MVNGSNALLAPRRIGVTGKVPWSKASEAFCAAIGRTLAVRETVVVTRGGVAQEAEEADPVAGQPVPVDKIVVDSAVTALEKAKKSPESWIETVVSEANRQDNRDIFRVGRVTEVEGQTYEAERFSFVNRTDGLIGIGGRGGTEQALVLALATERPILPVPVFNVGTSDYDALRVWNDHEKGLRARLRLDDEAVARWTQQPTAIRSARALAKEMVERLLSSMQRRCFVIMPFHDIHSALYDFVIEPAVSSLGDRPIRIDRVAIPGNVGNQIEDGIDNSDYVIVVLDGMRPNVMYELGMAHGRHKPTILLNRRGDLGDHNVIPFDLTMHQRLEYDEVDGQLPRRLQKMIRTLWRT